MEQKDSVIERTLSNLAGAWRDIAQSAARTIGLKARAHFEADPAALRALMGACLEARGGEVSARMRSAELGEAYLQFDAEGRRRFLEVLATSFDVDEAALAAAIDAYRDASDPDGRLRAGRRLRHATVPARVRLLTQFNALPDGIKFLVDLRVDLLTVDAPTPALKGLDSDLRELLSSWFDTGFLDLARVTWDSPASLLEKLIAYEAVHAIESWDDLRNRLESDRRMYALFHPRMPDEPLAFVEVALVQGIARNVQALLDKAAPETDPRAADTAIFYSISNTQRGLRGISFGEFLIKRVVQRLSAELPRIQTFATLSPIPGLRDWLDSCPEKIVEQAMSESQRGGVCALGGSDDTAEALRAILARAEWARDPVVVKALREPMTRLAARYFTERREDGQPIDPVARFHLKNGARLEHINWMGDTSPHGLRQSASLMANYRYVLDEIESNHEAYMKDGVFALGTEARALGRLAAEPEARAHLRRLGLR